MSFSILFQTISALIVCATFYVLAAALKDSRIKQRHPFLSGRVMKSALCGVLLSEFGFLILPQNADFFWVLFNTSVCVIILYCSSFLSSESAEQE